MSPITLGSADRLTFTGATSAVQCANILRGVEHGDLITVTMVVPYVLGEPFPKTKVKDNAGRRYKLLAKPIHDADHWVATYAYQWRINPSRFYRHRRTRTMRGK